MSAPRVTSSYAFHAQPYSFKNAVLLYGLYAVFTACWSVPACIGQQWRYQALVQFNEQDERELYEFFEVQG
jgi:hypothetical protein